MATAHLKANGSDAYRQFTTKDLLDSVQAVIGRYRPGQSSPQTPSALLTNQRAISSGRAII